MPSISPTFRNLKIIRSRCCSSTRRTAASTSRKPTWTARRSTSRTCREAPASRRRRRRRRSPGFFAQLRPHDYNAITAYIARNPTHAGLLDELRLKIRDAHRVATTVGFGPRFLHSTGQLHKGGPDTCVVLQITADDPDDPMIPGMNVGFRTLLAAQALGDWMSLDKRHRRGVRVHLKGDVEPALARAGRRRRRSARGSRIDRTLRGIEKRCNLGWSGWARWATT